MSQDQAAASVLPKEKNNKNGNIHCIVKVIVCVRSDMTKNINSWKNSMSYVVSQKIYIWIIIIFYQNIIIHW